MHVYLRYVRECTSALVSVRERSRSHLGDEKLTQANFTAFIFILLVTRPSVNHPAPYRKEKKREVGCTAITLSLSLNALPTPHPLSNTVRGRDNTSRPWSCCQPLNLSVSLCLALCGFRDERGEADQRKTWQPRDLYPQPRLKAEHRVTALHHSPTAQTCGHPPAHTHTHTHL